MNELIKKLVEAYGPSGFEEGMAALIRAEVEAYADDIRMDAMGNLIVHKKGNGPKVMVAAHMDEIGLMVTHIREDGFARVTNIGGINTGTLLGNRVQFGNGTIGVLYADLPEDRTTLPTLNKFYVDTGATSRADSPVEVGAAAGFVRPLLVRGKLLTSKTMDDRIGCVVAIEALKRLSQTPNDVYFVFSVQEEVGVRGALTAANAIQPEVGIALDVTLTGDMPEYLKMSVSIGKGTAIKVRDSGMIAHVGLVKLMRQRAEEAGIMYQLEVLEAGTTDAHGMQIAGAGCAAGCISIPCRYVHSQSETVHADDVEASIQLLTAVLANPINL